MIRRRVESTVEVEERVTDGVTEGVTDGTETVVPDGAFVVRDVGIDGGASWRDETVDKEAEGEEEREEEGRGWSVDDWAEEIEQFH